MSKSTELIKNTFILGFGRLTSQIIGFLLLPLYTHYLNPSEYGLVDIVTVYLSLLVPALTLQLEMASFRFLLDVRGDKLGETRVISNVTLLSISLLTPWLVIFIILQLVFEFNFGWEILATGLSIFAFNLLMQLSRGFGKNIKYAMSSIINAVMLIFGAWLFVIFLDLGTSGVLLSIACSYLIASIYLCTSLRIFSFIKWSTLEKDLQKELLGYSTPLVPNAASWWLINASGRTLITFFLGTTANGIYAVASKYSSILSSFFAIFTMSWTESASLYIDAPDRDKYFSRVANSTLRIFSTLGFVLIATMPFVFPFLSGPDYDEALLYIPILVCGAIFNVIVSIYSGIYIAKKLTKQVMMTSIAAGLINLVLTICLLPLFDLWAAAISTAIAFLIMAIYRHFDSKKYVNITYKASSIIWPLILGTVVITLYYLEASWTNLAALSIALILGVVINFGNIQSSVQMVSRRLSRKN